MQIEKQRIVETNPHTERLLRLARQLADVMEGQPLNAIPEITLVELMHVRYAEKNWRPYL